MSAKREVLESLSKRRLVDLAYTFETTAGPSTLNKGELVNELAPELSLPRPAAVPSATHHLVALDVPTPALAKDAYLVPFPSRSPVPGIPRPPGSVWGDSRESGAISE